MQYQLQTQVQPISILQYTKEFFACMESQMPINEKIELAISFKIMLEDHQSNRSQQIQLDFDGQALQFSREILLRNAIQASDQKLKDTICECAGQFARFDIEMDAYILQMAIKDDPSHLYAGIQILKELLRYEKPQNRSLIQNDVLQQIIQKALTSEYYQIRKVAIHLFTILLSTSRNKNLSKSLNTLSPSIIESAQYIWQNSFQDGKDVIQYLTDIADLKVMPFRNCIEQTLQLAFYVLKQQENSQNNDKYCGLELLNCLLQRKPKYFANNLEVLNQILRQLSSLILFQVGQENFKENPSIQEFLDLDLQSKSAEIKDTLSLLFETIGYNKILQSLQTTIEEFQIQKND